MTGEENIGQKRELVFGQVGLFGAVNEYGYLFLILTEVW